MDGREDNGLDGDMPFDDDDDMSDETNSVEGFEDDNDEDLMLELQLERNDPGLLNFGIDDGYNPSRGWEVLGESIGRNTMLNVLDIAYESLSELGMRFFRGLAKNRSIKELILRNCACGEILLYLTPFFMNNKSFESLDIRYFNCSNVPSEGRFGLEFALEQFNGLKELKFSAVGSMEGADKVIQALSSHTGLRELHLSGIEEGFSSLAAMLLKPSCSLSKLSLEYQSDIDDEMANILSSGLNGNGTLTELDILFPCGHRSTRKFTALGWKTIFVSLKSPACMINTLNLSHNHICDTALPFLVSALSYKNTIKALILISMDNKNAILQAMLQFLQSPSCMLESINLTANNFDNEKIESLTNALVNNCRLKELKLRGSKKVTPTGWHNLFQLLQRPSCGLESLDIGACDLTDETVQSLANAISHGSSLRELGLCLNRDVSSAAWQVLVDALRLHAPPLECDIDNDLTTSLLSSWRTITN
jgi:Ran GTPase-activating protein (RanGAP) involved in mRNA processing and transport